MNTRPVKTFEDPHLFELSNILNFAPDDLSKNRRGYISDRQIENLRHDINRVYSYAVNVLVGTLIIFGAITVATWSTSGLCFPFLAIVAGFFLLILKVLKTMQYLAKEIQLGLQLIK